MGEKRIGWAFGYRKKPTYLAGKRRREKGGGKPFKPTIRGKIGFDIEKPKRRAGAPSANQLRAAAKAPGPYKWVLGVWGTIGGRRDRITRKNELNEHFAG